MFIQVVYIVNIIPTLYQWTAQHKYLHTVFSQNILFRIFSLKMFNKTSSYHRIVSVVN